MSTTVSIIIPFYNPPKLRLRKCIESLINQTFTDFEVILVNDGCKDDYIEILNTYIEKDSRIKLINKENEGVSVARNVGIKASNGKYIFFIDADDYVESTFLDEMLNAIIDADLAVCGIEEQCFQTRNKWTDMKTFMMLPSDYAHLQYINFCHNKLYKADIIKSNNLSFPTDIKLGEDALFLVEYLKKINSMRIIDKRLYHYIPNSASAVTKYHKSFWDWEKVVIEHQYQLFNTYGLSKIQDMFLKRWIYEKFKYAFYYYIDHHENDAEILEYIYSHELLKDLLDSNFKENMFFNKNDKVILTFWKKYKVKGVILARKLSLLVKRSRE